jgi:hypothetical protein
MDATQKAATHPMLIFGRHVVGIAVLALANPLVYIDQHPVFVWFLTWLMALGVAGVLYALYALFFTARAKAAWPGSFFMLAWVLVGLVVVGGWSDFNSLRSSSEPQKAQSPEPGPWLEYQKGR